MSFDPRPEWRNFIHETLGLAAIHAGLKQTWGRPLRPPKVGEDVTRSATDESRRVNVTGVGRSCGLLSSDPDSQVLPGGGSRSKGLKQSYASNSRRKERSSWRLVGGRNAPIPVIADDA